MDAEDLVMVSHDW